MSEKELATKFIADLGTGSNIKTVYNCYTRVRAEVVDLSKVNQDSIKGTAGVIGVVVAGQQVQIIVGPGKSVKVAQAINVELAKGGASASASSTPKSNEDQNALDAKEKEDYKKEYLAAKEKERNKHGRASALFKKIAGIFVPIIPAFIACGLLLAILEIVKTQLGPDFATDTIPGKIFNAISGSVFNILSIIVGYNACKEFGGDGILGACLAGVMTSPILGSIDDPIITLGALKIYSGLGGVISVIFVSIAAAYFEKLLRKFMPNAIDAFMTPLITLSVMSLAGLFVFMPIGGYISLGIQKAVEGIMTTAPFLLGIVPMFYLLMVLIGVHHVLIPISQTLISANGYSILVPIQLMAGAAEVGAAIYFLIRSKNKRMKKTVAESIPIGILGIDEPLIWGMTFPLKRLFIPIGLAGGISGAILAVILNNLSSGSLVPESTGIEAALVMSGTSGKWVFAVAFIGAIILGFVCTALIGFKDVYQEQDANGNVVEKTQETSLGLVLYNKWKVFYHERKGNRSGTKTNKTITNEENKEAPSSSDKKM